MNIPTGVPPSQSNQPPAAAELLDPWAFFDRVYCISLKSREDRRRTVTAELAKVGLKDRVTFRLVDKHPESSERGIYESHMACLRDGLAAGVDRIVVFEDDLLIHHFKRETLSQAIDFLQQTPDWQIFVFGCFVVSSKSTASPAVRSIRYRCAAHAYAVTRAMAEKLIAIPWNGTAFDDLLRQLDSGNYYIAYPAFAFQSNSPTDNEQRRGTDRARRLSGGLYFGQRWDEFFHRNWRMMIVMHLLSIALIVFVVIAIRRWW